jgi:transcriptional regulator with XRE-family HTH domain
MSTQLTQRAYLRAAKDRLGLDWDTLAVRAGIAPRALKNYLLPPTSPGHRALPALARAAIEDLVAASASAAPVPSQQELLRAAKAAQGLTWDALAEAAGVSPRAMKNWRLPATSANHRSMPALARHALEKLLRAPRAR